MPRRVRRKERTGRAVSFPIAATAIAMSQTLGWQIGNDEIVAIHLALASLQALPGRPARETPIQSEETSVAETNDLPVSHLADITVVVWTFAIERAEVAFGRLRNDNSLLDVNDPALQWNLRKGYRVTNRFR